MIMSPDILIINLGSTSTKLAFFSGRNQIMQRTFRHSVEEVSRWGSTFEQYSFRRKAVLSFIHNPQVRLSGLKAVVSRGGTTKPLPGGVYQINDAMIKDLLSGFYGVHITNVGGRIAYELAKSMNILALTVDTPVTDELCAFARFSGIAQIKRQSSFHALNQKAAARFVADKLGSKYEEISLVVVHLGGGISVGAHQQGLVIDVNNALDGDGPFSPERSGGLPVGGLIKMCFSGQYSMEEMYHQINGNGGLASYLGTKSGEDIEERIKANDKYAELVYKSMAYQVAKEVGAMVTVLKGRVTAIVIVGGLANSEMLTNWIKERVSFIAPVYILAGEMEMQALAEGAARVLNGEENIKDYEEEAGKLERERVNAY